MPPLCVRRLKNCTLTWYYVQVMQKISPNFLTCIHGSRGVINVPRHVFLHSPPYHDGGKRRERESWNNLSLSSFWGHREFLERLDRRFRSRSVLGLPRFLRAMREIEMHLKLERSLFSLCLWVTKRNKLPSAMPQRDPSNFSRSASPRTSVEIGMYRVATHI